MYLLDQGAIHGVGLGGTLELCDPSYQDASSFLGTLVFWSQQPGHTLSPQSLIFCYLDTVCTGHTAFLELSYVC